MVDIPGPAWREKFKPTKLVEVWRTVVFSLALIAILMFGLVVWRHFHPSVVESPVDGQPLAAPSAIEQLNRKNTQILLKKNKYSGYQRIQVSLASQYLSNKDFVNAERIMNEVLKNVPPPRIEPGTYMMMVSLYKEKSDQDKYKIYLKLTAEKLRGEGRSVEAKWYEDEYKKI